MSKDGRIRGSYLHGLFASNAWRNDYMAQIGVKASSMAYREQVESALDALADHLETHINPDVWAIPR